MKMLMEAQNLDNQIKEYLNEEQERNPAAIKQKFEPLQIMEQYKYLVQGEYPYITQHDNNVGEINAASISPDENLLVTCTNVAVNIHTSFADILITQIRLQEQQMSVAFLKDSTKCILGSDKGKITIINTFDDFGQILNQFYGHKDCIYYIQPIKQDQQIITSSKNNTIKIFQLENQTVILTIDILCDYFIGFDYSEKYNFILGPNNDQLMIWDAEDGNCIMMLENIIEYDTFVQIVLSSKQNQALVNLYESKQILVVNVNYELRQMVLRHLKETRFCNFNVSWCLEDKAFLQVYYNVFNVRYLEDPKMPLIGESICFCSKPFLYKQDPNLTNLISIRNASAQVYFQETRQEQYQILKHKK